MLRLSSFVTAPAILAALLTIAAGPAAGQSLSGRMEALIRSETALDWRAETVTLLSRDLVMAATLVRPEGEGPHPAVLMLHGFTGQRHEVPVEGADEALFTRTARMLAEQGIASLRIDFVGSGESEGLWEDTTFSGQIADAQAALSYLRGLQGVDAARVGVLGFSQGGLVASALAASAGQTVAATVLWAPVASPPYTYGNLLGPETLVRGLAAGGDAIDVDLPWDVRIRLKGGFFSDLFSIDPLAEMARYGGPLMVIVGTRDEVVWPQPHWGEAYMRYHDGEEALVVLDADHLFSSTEGAEKVDEAVWNSIAWFDIHLR